MINSGASAAILQAETDRQLARPADRPPESLVDAGALYFIRDAIRDEFLDEVSHRRLKLSEISANIFFGRRAERLYWVLDYWPVQRLRFSSISDAAKQLRRMNKNWAYAGGVNFRRGALIAAELRTPAEKELVFPVAAAAKKSGAFTLEAGDSLLLTGNALKKQFAGGKIRFVEDKKGPPSRAYLKLYEALTLADKYPMADDRVVDLGATPGGWSYVAASLGANVQMIDRAAPDEALMRKFSKLRFLKGDGLNPPDEILQKASVLLSDMACEPVKLISALRRWLTYPGLRLMVCTLKFHGISDKDLIGEFAAIPGSEIYHLWQNGHELTWIWQRA